jgi:hypothetical protein
MNASDGGKHRPNMSHVGIYGLRTVLTAMGVKVDGMNVEAMRAKLWECSVVAEQLTMLEDLCKAQGVILLYNPKAPPRLSPCEVFSPFIFFF